MDKWKLKRHESFILREGWTEKALHALNENGRSAISKENGTMQLGIGANMVKSVRFWLFVTGLTNAVNDPTDLSDVVLRYDPYLDDDFTWWILHINLALNYKELPVFNFLFNNIETKRFSKEDLLEIVKEYMLSNQVDGSNFNLVGDDISAMLRTYTQQKMETPEDNLNSPFGRLELINENEKDNYSFNVISHDKLNYLVVYYLILKLVEKSCNAEDLYDGKDSPAKILRIDKNQFYGYLNEMKNNGLITLNRTAGLNMIYLDRRLDADQIFRRYFKGGK